MTSDEARVLKAVHWARSSRDDLRAFPKEASRDIGYALWFAQMGTKRHQDADACDATRRGAIEVGKIRLRAVAQGVGK